MTRQIVVECSDPGLVVSLAEEFEHVMRQVDFARAQVLREHLSDLAHELGPEFEQAWRGFRLETPNDRSRPLTFGNREMPDEERIERLLRHAEERNIGTFEVYHTSLLPQHGPRPETREQYVRDLADAIHSASWGDLGVLRHPVPLPERMAAHREQLMEEMVSPLLRSRARFPRVGRQWVQKTLKRVEDVLHEVDTRAEAVQTYELNRLAPRDIEPDQRINWAALAARLGVGLEKWYTAVEESWTYLYQKAAWGRLIWSESQGWGAPRTFLKERFEAYIKQAETIYTADGVDALRLIYDELQQPSGQGLAALLAKEEEAEADESTPVDEPI